MRIPKAQREALARQDALFIAEGLRPGDPRSTEAHLRHTALLLRDRQARSPCAKAVAHVAGLFERSIPSVARGAIACASGCAWCCHQPVFVTPPEAFFVADQIRTRTGTIAAMERALSAVAGRQADAERVPWVRCPLLGDDNLCSVYASRPLACHAYVSIRVEDCRHSYPHPGNATVTAPAAYREVRELCRMILLAAARVNGLTDAGYEMNAAVIAVLGADNAEKRWLRGEDIFAGIPQTSPLSPQDDRKIAFMAASIAPTL
jgi:Fe-S-cluster containining protein